MKKHLLLGATLVVVAASFAFKGTVEHFKGYIEDSTCAASKTDMGMTADRVKCATKCIKGGAAAVLVSDGKVYKIANQKAVIKYAGEDVLVDGTVADSTINVTKIVLDK